MSESCLVIHPAATRNEGMRQGSAGMGLNSREVVSDVDTIRPPDMRSQMSPAVERKGHLSPHNHVSDESETSECKTNNKQNDDSTNMQITEEATTTTTMRNGESAKTPKRKLGSLQRSGPVLEQEEDEANGASGPSSSSETNKTLPQHERIQEVEPLDISYVSTPASLKLRGVLVSRLSEISSSGRIQVIDLSRRGLVAGDAELIRYALRNNPQLAVLKLGDNNLGDRGTSIIASSCSKDGRHHQSLTVLDLGFNEITDEGLTELSLHMVAGNHILRNLYLSGNQFKKKGAMALAGAILHGCSLTRLHLSSNKLGSAGTKVLAGAIAEMDARRQHLLQRQGGIVIAAVKPPAIEDLQLSDISMKANGIVTISSMMVSNASLQVLNLSNNEIDDKHMAVLSQGLAQNKRIPLVSISLSFNKITCAGVECLMNAIWGSPTLKQMKLDNNKMQDRGAQLCSVVLSSIRLELLDISFNRVSTVGIKAMMKSLSENDSLKSLSLSGIPMDQNASKAVSYALAYNASLEVFNIDSCCVGYSGQRHIVAGIVSNRSVKLRTITGFPLGAITKTLGLPQVPEDWGNDRVLSFVRYMWSHWRTKGSDGVANAATRGPAPPASVAASGKSAFASLSTSEDAKMEFQKELTPQSDDSPMIAPDTSILVRSPSGQNLQIPHWSNELGDADVDHSNDSFTSESDSFGESSYTDSSSGSHPKGTGNTERRNKNLQWLRAHFQSLTEVGNLVFNNADLWQLHQYFFSPAYGSTEDSEQESTITETSDQDRNGNKDCSISKAPPPTPVASDAAKKTSIERAISFQTLGKAVAEAAETTDNRPSKKRGSLEETLRDAEPCAKRAKNLKPRIAYYPRIREKLESLGTKPSTQTLSLLRQLKYIESVMLQDKNVYADGVEDDGGPGAPDVEMVLLDLL